MLFVEELNEESSSFSSFAFLTSSNFFFGCLSALACFSSFSICFFSCSCLLCSAMFSSSDNSSFHTPHSTLQTLNNVLPDCIKVKSMKFNLLIFSRFPFCLHYLCMVNSKSAFILIFKNK